MALYITGENPGRKIVPKIDLEEASIEFATDEIVWRIEDRKILEVSLQENDIIKDYLKPIMKVLWNNDVRLNIKNVHLVS